MAFKDFSKFSTAISKLKEQLDKNALLVRVINRVSTIITNCQQVPGAYTTKYNSVQLLEYDSNGKLQDATPAQQLTVPQSILDTAVADIESNQRLVESDLKVASTLPLPVKVDVEGADVSSFSEDGASVKVLSSQEAIVIMNSSNAVIASFIQDNYPEPLPIGLAGTKGKRVFANAGNSDMWITGIRYLGDRVSLILVELPGSHGYVVVRAKANLQGNLTTSYQEVGEVIASNTPQFKPKAVFRVKLDTDNTTGFSSGVYSVINFSTLAINFLFTLSNRTSNNLDTGVIRFAGYADLANILYPKAQIDALKSSLK